MKAYYAISLVFFVLASSATFDSHQALDPQSEEFLSQVRYIISSEEIKIFKELPPSERKNFINEFWARRDPVPDTPSNEFKEEYFRRIDKANRLFKGARPGWLQDRGRIYIIFGPPDERQTNPMGGRVVDPYVDPQQMVDSERYARGEKANEVWIYYNLFSTFQRPHVVRLVFVDKYGTGYYQLATNIDEVIPGKADALIGPNLWLLHEMNKEEYIKIQEQLKKSLFDFDWEFIPQKNKELESNLMILIKVPYEKVIFKVENNTVKAVLDLKIEVKNSDKTTVWEYSHQYNLVMTHQEMKDREKEYLILEIPVTKQLQKGNYSFYFILKNISGDQEVKKLLFHKI